MSKQETIYSITKDFKGKAILTIDIGARSIVAVLFINGEYKTVMLGDYNSSILESVVYVEILEKDKVSYSFGNPAYQRAKLKKGVLVTGFKELFNYNLDGKKVANPHITRNDGQYIVLVPNTDKKKFMVTVNEIIKQLIKHVVNKVCDQHNIKAKDIGCISLSYPSSSLQMKERYHECLNDVCAGFKIDKYMVFKEAEAGAIGAFECGKYNKLDVIDCGHSTFNITSLTSKGLRLLVASTATLEKGGKHLNEQLLNEVAKQKPFKTTLTKLKKDKNYEKYLREIENEKHRLCNEIYDKIKNSKDESSYFKEGDMVEIPFEIQNKEAVIKLPTSNVYKLLISQVNDIINKKLEVNELAKENDSEYSPELAVIIGGAINNKLMFKKINEMLNIGDQHKPIEKFAKTHLVSRGLVLLTQLELLSKQNNVQYVERVQNEEVSFLYEEDGCYKERPLIKRNQIFKLKRLKWFGTNKDTVYPIVSFCNNKTFYHGYIKTQADPKTKTQIYATIIDGSVYIVFNNQLDDKIKIGEATKELKIDFENALNQEIDDEIEKLEKKYPELQLGTIKINNKSKKITSLKAPPKKLIEKKRKRKFKTPFKKTKKKKIDETKKVKIAYGLVVSSDEESDNSSDEEETVPVEELKDGEYIEHVEEDDFLDK